MSTTDDNDPIIATLKELRIQYWRILTENDQPKAQLSDAEGENSDFEIGIAGN
jgi:hypothetical protein